MYLSNSETPSAISCIKLWQQFISEWYVEQQRIMTHWWNLEGYELQKGLWWVKIIYKKAINNKEENYSTFMPSC